MKLKTLITFREHSFFTGPLTSDSVVVDAGGNIGHFSQGIAEQFGPKQFVLEPMPDLLAQIETHPKLKKLPWALAAEAKTYRFNVSSNPEANSLRSLKQDEQIGVIDVRGVSLKELMEEQSLDSIDLLKMDIEGAEIGVLLNSEKEVLSRISQITAEFHAHTIALDRDSHAELKQIHAVIARLNQLGFICINRTSPWYIDVLFVNKSRLGLSPIKAIWIKFRYEHVFRISNAVKRRLFKASK